MSRLAATPALLALAGCSLLAVRPAERPAPPVPTARAVHLARVRCLLLAPFENASDDPLAAEAATATFTSSIDPNRTRVYPIAELRALFKDTSLELPEGVSPSLALELAELIGADAALYGAVEGRSRGSDPSLTVTVRLAAAGARDLLFARVVEVRPGPDEATADVVRRAVLEAAGPMLERIGLPGRKVCFDRQRTDRLRLMALAGEQRGAFASKPSVTQPLPPAPAPVAPLPPPPPTPEAPQTAVIGAVEILAPVPKAPHRAEPAVEAPERAAVAEPPAGPAPTTLAVRQAEWLTRLQSGGRVLVDDVAFAGRTAQLEKESGLADVVALLGVAPGLKVRLEGFVDASNDPDADLRLSMEMARATGKRLIELGVARDRLTWAGRGGEAPLLPNFTARGRQTNRRIELVPVP